MWEVADRSVGGQEGGVEGAEPHRYQPPRTVKHRVPAVEDAPVARLDHPGDLGITEAVDRWHSGHREGFEVGRLPRIQRTGCDSGLGQSALRVERGDRLEAFAAGSLRAQHHAISVEDSCNGGRVCMIGVEMGEQGG